MRLALEFIGGLAAFIFGMKTLSGGLGVLAGGRTERILSRLTDSPLRAGFLGAGATAAVQSSSAVTVMLIGMAEAGQIGLSSAGYILLGANVGTTLTPWLLSLAGIRGEGALAGFLSPAGLAPVVAIVGAGLLLVSGSGRRRSIAEVFCGFGVLMLGMERMQTAVAPLQDLAAIPGAEKLLASPLLAAASAALFTALIQSSTASVAILQALAAAGSLNAAAVLPAVMGQNVGTCITGMLSALGTGNTARAVARFNLAINVIGAGAGVGLMYLLRPLCSAFLSRPATAAGIALWHSLFNILSAVLLWPAVPRLCRRVRPRQRKVKKYLPTR